MNVDAAGWCEVARRIDSPNCDARPPDAEISLLMLWITSRLISASGGPGVEQLFTNRLDPSAHPYYATIHSLRVSSHFFIRRDGELVQFVPCSQRAWHAGVSSWRGRERCNDFSIGVELEGSDEQPFSDAQYRCLNELIESLRAAYPGLLDIAGHSDIAPGRKTDPGPCFDWSRVKNC